MSKNVLTMPIIAFYYLHFTKHFYIFGNGVIIQLSKVQILTLFGVICIDYMVTSPHKHNIFKSQAWDMIKYLIIVTFEKYNKSDQPDICAINEIKKVKLKSLSGPYSFNFCQVWKFYLAV